MIKKYLRTISNQEKTTNHAIISIKLETVDEINYNDIIDSFISTIMIYYSIIYYKSMQKCNENNNLYSSIISKTCT